MQNFASFHRVIPYNQVFMLGNLAPESVKNMKKLLLLVVLLGLTSSLFAAEDDDNKAADRVKSASTILEEIQAAPDTGIPDVFGSSSHLRSSARMRRLASLGGAIEGAWLWYLAISTVAPAENRTTRLTSGCFAAIRSAVVFASIRSSLRFANFGLAERKNGFCMS